MWIIARSAVINLPIISIYLDNVTAYWFYYVTFIKNINKLKKPCISSYPIINNYENFYPQRIFLNKFVLQDFLTIGDQILLIFYINTPLRKTARRVANSTFEDRTKLRKIRGNSTTTVLWRHNASRKVVAHPNVKNLRLRGVPRYFECLKERRIIREWKTDTRGRTKPSIDLSSGDDGDDDDVFLPADTTHKSASSNQVWQK